MPDKIRSMGHGYPGTRVYMMHEGENADGKEVFASSRMVSRLNNWPIQIKLAPVNAPYYDGSMLLIAADCTAYAYADFHQNFMEGKVILIGFPIWYGCAPNVVNTCSAGAM